MMNADILQKGKRSQMISLLLSQLTVFSKKFPQKRIAFLSHPSRKWTVPESGIRDEPF
jgi:hypothetical protein